MERLTGWEPVLPRTETVWAGDTLLPYPPRRTFGSPRRPFGRTADGLGGMAFAGEGIGL